MNVQSIIYQSRFPVALGCHDYCFDIGDNTCAGFTSSKSSMMAFTVSCRECNKDFKTGYSVQKHYEKVHTHSEFNGGIFRDSQGQTLRDAPIAKQLGSAEMGSYRTWLALLTEQLTGSLSPNAKGKNTGVFGHSRGFGGCLEHASRNCCNGHNKLVTIVIQWR